MAAWHASDAQPDWTEYPAATAVWTSEFFGAKEVGVGAVYIWNGRCLRRSFHAVVVSMEHAIVRNADWHIVEQLAIAGESSRRSEHHAEFLDLVRTAARLSSREVVSR